MLGQGCKAEGVQTHVCPLLTRGAVWMIPSSRDVTGRALARWWRSDGERRRLGGCNEVGAVYDGDAIVVL